MTLKEIFKRRNINATNRLTGPRGYIEFKHDLNGNPIKLWVVVNISDKRNQHSVERILNDPKYTLCEDGEYSFDLDFSDNSRALQLIGYRVDRRG